jgi:hypothetical protein
VLKAATVGKINHYEARVKREENCEFLNFEGNYTKINK